MLENCKRLICSPSLNKVYCIVLYCIDTEKNKRSSMGGCEQHRTDAVTSLNINLAELKTRHARCLGREHLANASVGPTKESK